LCTSGVEKKEQNKKEERERSNWSYMLSKVAISLALCRFCCCCCCCCCGACLPFAAPPPAQQQQRLGQADAKVRKQRNITKEEKSLIHTTLSALLGFSKNFLLSYLLLLGCDAQEKSLSRAPFYF